MPFCHGTPRVRRRRQNNDVEGAGETLLKVNQKLQEKLFVSLKKKVFLFLFGLSSADLSLDDGPSVTTKSGGTVLGRLESSAQGNPFAAFYSIYYAENPTGELRFRVGQCISTTHVLSLFWGGKLLRQTVEKLGKIWTWPIIFKHPKANREAAKKTT